MRTSSKSLLRSPNAVVFGVSLVALFVQLLWAAPLLPDTVASHFDVRGEPDSWMTRSTFLAVMALVHAVTAVSVGGVGLWLPKVNDTWINLPNKDHWLAPERRDATLADVARLVLMCGGGLQAAAQPGALVRQRQNGRWPNRVLFLRHGRGGTCRSQIDLGDVTARQPDQRLRHMGQGGHDLSLPICDAQDWPAVRVPAALRIPEPQCLCQSLACRCRLWAKGRAGA